MEAKRGSGAEPIEQPAANRTGRDLDWVDAWLSEERFAPYLAACGLDAEKALELYKWNVGLGGALMRDISFFEVALRNRYDAVMRETWDGGRHWLVDAGSPVRRPVMRGVACGDLDVNRINRKIIDAAIDRLPDDYSERNLVSSLTLGFWVHLTDRSREVVIWRTRLHRVWPKGTKRSEIHRSLGANQDAREIGAVAPPLERRIRFRDKRLAARRLHGDLTEIRSERIAHALPLLPPCGSADHVRAGSVALYHASDSIRHALTSLFFLDFVIYA